MPSSQNQISAKLVAIVEVNREARVQCQQPGCGHGVWKAIHVVEEQAGQLMVLGSSCFATRFGASAAIGSPSIGAGTGKRLNDEQRRMLVENTRELLAQLEAERQAEIQVEKEKLAALRLKFKQREAGLLDPNLGGQTRHAQGFGRHDPGRSPWPWMMPMTSMAYFKLTDGSGWVRVKHADGRQALAPLPPFDGWDEALPTLVGIADLTLHAYVVEDVRRAIAYLRQRSVRECISGLWREIVDQAGQP